MAPRCRIEPQGTQALPVLLDPRTKQLVGIGLDLEDFLFRHVFRFLLLHGCLISREQVLQRRVGDSDRGGELWHGRQLSDLLRRLLNPQVNRLARVAYGCRVLIGHRGL